MEPQLPKEDIAPMAGTAYECQCLQVPEFTQHQVDDLGEFPPLPGWAPLFPQPNL